MTHKTIRGGLAVVALMPFSALATGPDCEGSFDGNFDGRFYEVVVYGSEDDKNWDGARTAAEGMMTHDGIQGQLATINSPGEDEYLYCLVNGTEGAREAWVGGFQEACDSEDPEPGCGWQWINGEPIAPTNRTSPPFTTSNPYTHWQDGEPNDDTAPGGNEMHLAINLGNDFGWNDEGRLGNIGSYVVEYGDKLASIPAVACAAGGPGCPLGDGEDPQIIKYPAGAIVAGEMEVRTWRIPDDPSRCGVDALVLDLVPADGAIVIPAYLCATIGDITVRRTSAPDVVINSGVVEIVNQTEKYGCDDPITGGDETAQDAVIYRATQRADQLEDAYLTGVNSFFVGNAHDFHNGCVNPSRGSGGKGSYFIEGTRIHFGPGNDDPAFRHMQMIALQRDKLTVTRGAVLAAKPALKPLDWLALKVLVDSAIYFHDRGNYSAALFKLGLLRKLNGKVKYTVIPGKNYQGEILYRILNDEDMYRRRIIPFSSSP